jgi:2-iminoacetate synthase
MLLYAPLYLSSFCINHCLYCGFRYPHELERQHLGRDEVLSQAEFLRQKGFRHILLVAGDFPRLTSRSYLVEMVALLAGAGFSVAVEIAAQTTFAYAHLARAGACGVTLYQETYQEALYNRYHPLGTKVWFDWRLEAPERAAEAGLARLGLGILLGLADSRQDLRALVGHGRYLTNRFPHVRLALSLPRIHEAPEGFEIPFPVDDDMFIRLYCTLRLAFPSAELVLSTREPPALRDRLAAVCITQMSAGSCTVPGGYGTAQQDSPQREQFPVHDQRSPAEVADYLNRAGFAVRWQIS